MTDDKLYSFKARRDFKLRREPSGVGTLSLLGRPDLTVSTPLTWAHDKANLNPIRFTMRTVPALMKKTNAWDDYCDGDRALERAIELMAKSNKAAN